MTNKLKKVSEETTFKKETKEIILELNGKTVYVYKHILQDNLTGEYDMDYDIERSFLTEEENEFLDDNLYDALDLEEGQELN